MQGRLSPHTLTGQVEDYGIDLSSGSASVNWASAPVYSAADAPFDPKTQVYNAPIVATTRNGLTVGYDMNDYLYFGGNTPMSLNVIVVSFTTPRVFSCSVISKFVRTMFFTAGIFKKKAEFS